MKKRILEYRERIDNILSEAKDEPRDKDNWKSLIDNHIIQIGFFQHERLVHLIVTVLVALVFILCFGIAMISAMYQMFIPAVMLFGLFIPYISHYYLLENEVQKMYNQYDEMMKLSGELFDVRKVK